MHQSLILHFPCYFPFARLVYNNGINPEAMLLKTAGITAVSKALNAANSAAVSSKGGPKYKKAPDAPKRFKSAFIIFSAEKHKEIKEDLISQGRTEKVSCVYDFICRGKEFILPINSANQCLFILVF